MRVALLFRELCLTGYYGSKDGIRDSIPKSFELGREMPEERGLLGDS